MLNTGTHLFSLNVPVVSVERSSSLLDQSVILSKEDIEGAFYGLAVGDARGLPFETLDPKLINNVMDSSPECYFPLTTNEYLKDHNYQPGQVSDDLHLSLAMLRAIISGLKLDGSVLIDSICNAHVEALSRGPVGWGPSTRQAVERIRNGIPWKEAGEINSSPNKGWGNGVPMKIAPFGILAALQDLPSSVMDEMVKKIALLTHPRSVAISAGLAHVDAIRYCLSVSPAEFSRSEFIDIVVSASERGEKLLPDTKASVNITNIFKELYNWKNYADDQIRNAFGEGVCCVYHSLPFSYMFFLQDPFSFETVDRVIRAGGDTDSNGAFVGSLIGALNGRAIVPNRMVSGLKGIEGLEDAINQFWELVISHNEKPPVTPEQFRNYFYSFN